MHGLNTYVVYNISVEEIAAPVVSVIFPENNTENKSSNDIVFLFNVTDSSSVSNCSLYINDEYNDTLTPIPLNTTLNFTKYLENGVYNWSINCTDVTLLEGTSGIYYLNVSVYYPNILFFEQIPSIILVPGSVKEVQCNFTVEDGNGASDIDSVNATFYSTTVMSTDPDDNSTHYTNTSCENTGISGNQSNFTCSFNVYYYALNGTWECNATAIDAQNLIETNNTNTTIEPLYALNVSQLFISYGSLSSSEYSGDRQLDITNFGNMNLNISTRAYGGNDPLVGNNTAMLCDSGYNISLDNERYSLSSGIGFESKTPVNYFNEDMGFTIQKQISPSALSINSTYWELLVPPLPVTFCNGTIVLTASEP